MAATKVKSILVSQPKPETEKSPYYDLAKSYNVKIDFRSFIHLEPIEVTDFRKYKLNLNDYTAIILTSRNAADHFFRIFKEMRLSHVDNLKFFCTTESTAYYLQKYITYRKRKIFFGNGSLTDLSDYLKKNKKEKFLFPCSDTASPEMFGYLKELKIDFDKAILYKTVCSDLSDLANIKYDMLVFFSPTSIKSLMKNFPKFKQNTTRIAAFGNKTSKAIAEAGLRLDIAAPVPESPSMTMSIESYLKQHNKR